MPDGHISYNKELTMKKFRFLLTLGGSLLVMMALTTVIFSSNAGAVPLTNVSIGWSGAGYNNWYTVYTFQARLPNGMLLAPNPLAAFCVDPAHADADASYELVPAGNYTATKMADFYFNSLNGTNNTYTQNGITKAYTQRDFQIAIWHALGMITGYSLTAPPPSSELAAQNIFNGIILGGSTLSAWNGYDKVGPIALAQSPAYGYADDSQDYLIGVPVPEPATVLLMGIGILGLGIIARKKNHC